jgi:TPR repeat protein
MEVETNQIEAARWFCKAAEMNFALSQNNLGVCFENGWGVSNSIEEAVRWYQRAADQGMPLANQNLARLANSGKNPALKRASYQGYLEQAAERGDLQSANDLGWSHLNPQPGETGSPELAAYWLAYAGQNEFLGAYANIGWLYMDGDWVPRDLDEARQWFTKGEARGDARCLLGLAMHELIANAAAPDLEKARDWMLKAADKNLPAAFYQLGRLSELQGIAHRPDIKPDYEQAVRWYQRAVDEGFQPAARRLAEIAVNGSTAKREDIILRLQQAADMGDREAQLQLALRYWAGEGKPRNAEEEPATLLQSLANTGSAKAMVQLAEFIGRAHISQRTRYNRFSGSNVPPLPPYTMRSLIHVWLNSSKQWTKGVQHRGP